MYQQIHGCQYFLHQKHQYKRCTLKKTNAFKLTNFDRNLINVNEKHFFYVENLVTVTMGTGRYYITHKFGFQT